MRKREFATGDLNLAAAILTVGIPPIESKPISLVATDTGHDYKRFHFELTSACGKHDVYSLGAGWNSPESFRATHPAHPFSKMMSFISSKPHGIRGQDDWLNHAAVFLGITRDAVSKAYADIANVCRNSPESEVSYVLAFIRNREWLISCVKRMDSDGDFDVIQSIGKSIVSLSAKASKRTGDFLMSHVK